MTIGTITNENVFTIDFARADRQMAIKAMSRGVKVKKAAARSASYWMVDVAGMDNRSVKAQLSGHRSLRAAWWNVFCGVYQAVSPKSSMEDVMFAFHKFHHSITLFIAESAHDYGKLVYAIKSEGLGKAAKNYVENGISEMKSK